VFLIFFPGPSFAFFKSSIAFDNWWLGSTGRFVDLCVAAMLGTLCWAGEETNITYSVL
jgi:hypothetical protein